MKNRTQFITAVLQDMGVVSVGATPAAEDVALIEVRLDPMLEDLSFRNVIYISDFQTFPDKIFQALVDLMVQICGPAFGRQKDRAEIELMEGRLRTIQRIGTGRPDGTLLIEPAITRPFWRYGRRL